ncbi:MAG: response regulator transcription factor [Alphaproteobacteria bacterium]|nr:MAG: response regulator transcription factor [Alphaproteobacteria bacterium]
MSGPVKRVMLADHHDMVRLGIRTLLDGKPQFTVVAEAAESAEAIELAQQCRPDIAIMDYALPGSNGIEAGKAMKAVLPALEVVLFTLHSRESVLIEAMQAGICGYVLKSDPERSLLDALAAAAIQRRYISREISETVIARVAANAMAPEGGLTRRERSIVELIAGGKLNKQIADLLSISIKTVETHRARAMEKLELGTSADLVRYVVRNGWIEP